MSENVERKMTVLIVGDDCQWVKILDSVFSTSFLVVMSYILEPCLITRADVMIVVGDRWLKKEVEKYPEKLPLTYFGVFGSGPQPNRDGVTVFDIEKTFLSSFVQRVERELARKVRNQ